LSTLIPKRTIIRQVTRMLFCITLLAFIAPAFAQGRHPAVSRELKEFNKELADADLSFSFPPGFKEAKANSEDAFDYGIELSDGDFEIWFQVKSLKENKLVKIKSNPDSLYLDMGRAQATAYVGDDSYIIRNIPPNALSRYNADAGKTFLLNLPDSPVTKHYKYAMVVVLQKNHEGTLLATCFANELGPGFFKSLNQASSCIKFNQ